MSETLHTMGWDVFNDPEKHTQIRAEVTALKNAIRMKKTGVDTRQVRPLVCYEDGRRGDIVADVLLTSYGLVVVTREARQLPGTHPGPHPYDRATQGWQIQPLTGDRAQTFWAVTRRRSIPLAGWMFLDALAAGRRRKTVTRPSV